MNYFETEITPPAFVNGLSNRYRPFGFEYGMLTKLIAVSPDPLEWLKKIKYVGTRLGYMERLDLASYDSIGVYLQIRLRHFATQISITLTSIAP